MFIYFLLGIFYLGSSIYFDFSQYNLLLNFYVFNNLKNETNYYQRHLIQLQQMQAKLWKKGFTNTASGNMNERMEMKHHKILDLDDFDVQMLSPQFLQAKTLKKPISQMGIHLQKTNPNGIGIIDEQPTSQRSIKNQTFNNFTKSLPQKPQTQQPHYSFIQGKQLNIRPAYQPNIRKDDLKVIEDITPQQLNLKDKNSIISALFKKGQLKYTQQISIKVSQPPQQKKTVGPAQKKLKQIFGKDVEQKKPLAPTLTAKDRKKSIEEEIGEEINESIEEYGNESFQKISGAYESAIKQSIRESIIGGSSSAIRQQIPQALSFRDSMHKSADQIKESINESIRESLKNSAQQDVYEQIFEEVSISDQISKSRTSKFKKSKDHDDKFELSVSASKGFRTKTNTVVKSIRFAEEINANDNKKNLNEKFQEKLNKGDKIAAQLLKEKQRVKILQEKVSNIMNNKKTSIDKNMGFEKNQDLLYRFRIEINRLITSQNFCSKLRKLTGFLGQTPNQKSSQAIGMLEDKILKNLTENIESFKKSEISRTEIQAMKNHYDKQLQVLLRDQEIKLRVEMDKKLHDKDVQLKTMIAELQKKFSSGAQIIGGGPYQKDFQKYRQADKIQIQSDYSIQSDEVSWKADLWQLLPDYEKKKLYEKQGTQVANFLTSVIFKEIKQESLSRSGDLSFQFPQDLNVSSSFESSLPSLKKSKKSEEYGDTNMFKSAINRQELMKGLNSETQQQTKYPSLTDIKKKPRPQPIQINTNIENKLNQSNILLQTEKRDTVAASQVIKILSKYKPLYLKKKNDTIRKIIKTLQLKVKDSEPLSSYLTQLKILYDKQISPQDLPFVRAYEEQLVLELTGFYNKCGNRKYAYIEEQMRKIYDRYVVTCQIKAAESSTRLPIEIAPNENYIELRMKQQQKKLKDNIVEQIINILAAEFAKEMPKKKK